MAALSWENPLWLDSRLVMEPLKTTSIEKRLNSAKKRSLFIHVALKYIFKVFISAVSIKIIPGGWSFDEDPCSGTSCASLWCHPIRHSLNGSYQ